MRQWIALIALWALGCEDTSGQGESPELRAACDRQCAAQIDCGDTQLGMEECSDACVADVGIRDAACVAALEDLAACIADHCGDDAACADAWNARGNTCGGTG